MLTGFVLVSLVFICFIVVYLTKKKSIIRFFFAAFEQSSQELQDQLKETADLVVDRLEHKITELEEKITLADAKIIKLESLLTQFEDRTGSISSLQENIQAGKTQINVVSMGQGINQYKQAAVKDGQRVDLPAPEEWILSGHDVNNGAKPTLPVGPGPQADKRQIVYAMAEQGYSETDIAKATGIGKGEVHLLLQLGPANQHE